MSWNISIHAPTIGATEKSKLAADLLMISIHAPTIGATWCRSGCYPCNLNFNPRSHNRSDYNELGLQSNYNIFQSTLPR